MFICIAFLPVALSLTCNKLDSPRATLSTCKGDACGTYIDGSSPTPTWIQGCINRLNVSTGCSNNPRNTMCICATDLCNKAKLSDWPEPTKPRDSACPKTDFCSETYSCIFTTNLEIDQCTLAGDPKTLFEFFTGTVFHDRTFVPNSKKGTAKSSVTAHCESDKCMKLAKKLSAQKNFTSLEDQVTCYSYQDTSDYPFELNINASKQAQNHSCTGEFCYMSLKKESYEQNVVRGCLTVLDDSLAVTEVETGTYEYISLHAYLCKSNYCNLRDVLQINGQSPPLTSTTPKSLDTSPIPSESIGPTAVSTVTIPVGTITIGATIDSSAATVIIGVPLETTTRVAEPTTKTAGKVLNLVPLAIMMCFMQY